jgi:hypothetical protein
MRLLVWGAVVLGALGLVLATVYGRWRELTERERFLLRLKEVTTPQRMHPEESARLEFLRSGWWAVSHWLPDLWRRRG